MKLPWTISRKLFYLAFFCLISIAFFTFSMILYNQYTKVQQLDEYTIEQYEIIRESRLVLTDMIDMETGVRGYMISGDQQFLKPYYDGHYRLRFEIVNLRNATYDEPHAFAETNAWIGKIVAIQKLLDAQVVDIQYNGRKAASITDMGKEKALMNDLRQMMESSVAVRLKDLQRHTSVTAAQKNNFLYIIIIGNIVAIGVLLIGTVTIIRLESENEKFEEEKTRAEQRFRTIMSGINDGLYEYNFVNNSLYASKEFKAMLGYSEDDVESTFEATSDLIHPDDIAPSLEVRQQYITKQIPYYNNVFRMKHKDGTWRWVMSRGVGSWDKFGQIRSLIGTHTDITDQKNREEELRQLHADMEAFTYITSHDMRSPLVNLKGFSRELTLAIDDIHALIAPHAKKIGKGPWEKIETVLRHDVPEALGFIGKAVDRMDTLTTAILDLSRIGKYVYRDEVVDAQAIVDKCLGAQSYEITSKQVDVETTPLPTLVTDPLALEQIFGNLLDNAVKYLKPGEAGRIDIACHETERDYIFSVRDNGRGIEPDDAERIFQIFRRARNTGDVRGLGLGMAFVKATLRKLSGAIWFDSQLGIGTTFYVSLPRKTLPDKQDAKLEAKAEPANDQAAKAPAKKLASGGGIT